MSGVLEFKEPYRVAISAKWVGYSNGMMIGLAMMADGLHGVIVGEDGKLHALSTDDFAIEWRYDVQKDRWFDVSDGNVTVTDQEV